MAEAAEVPENQDSIARAEKESAMSVSIEQIDNTSDRCASFVNQTTWCDSRIGYANRNTPVYAWVPGPERAIGLQTKKCMLWVWDDNWVLWGMWETDSQPFQLAKIEQNHQVFGLKVNPDGTVSGYTVSMASEAETARAAAART